MLAQKIAHKPRVLIIMQLSCNYHVITISQYTVQLQLVLQKMFCVGCGTDVSANPKGRRNLTGGGAGAEEVLSAWKSLACQLFPSAGTGTCIDLSNPGKMCKGCFASFQKYYTLQEKLEKNLAVALVRIQPSKRQMTQGPSCGVDMTLWLHSNGSSC